MGKNTKPVKAIKTASLNEFIESLSAEVGPKEQSGLKTAFDQIPIYEVRKAIIDKIILSGKENFIWLAKRVSAYVKIKDDETALLFLEKIAHCDYKDDNHFEMTAIACVLGTWIDEDNRSALRVGLNILYEKIKREKIYTTEVKLLFEKIFEKYDNNNIERTENDFKMLDDLLHFVLQIGAKDQFIPVLGKTETIPYERIESVPRRTFGAAADTGDNKISVMQAMYEMDKGLVTGKGGYREVLEKTPQ